MGVERLRGLLFLVSGISFFTIMLLTLRLLSSNNKNEGFTKTENQWKGLEELEIVEVIKETHNVKSFRLKRINGLEFPLFKGGQFISFQIADDANTIRSYSLSSSDQNRQSVQVSVKLLPNGKGSFWFHQLRTGDRIKAYAPSGNFVDDQEGSEDRVLVAGGIGITPILSILLSNLEKAHSAAIHVFYGARALEDLVFHGLIEYLSQRHPQIHYYPVISNDSTWEGDQGYLTFDFIQSKLGSVEKQRFYICGPDAMTDPLLDGLENSSLSPENIFSEKFISPASFDDSCIPERNVKIKFSGKSLEYRGKKNLLDFLESQGESFPFACRSGVCGSCRCRIIGEFEMLTDAGLTRSEKREGLGLACVSFPKSDLEISSV